jgi:hypothetical protein
MIDIFILLGFIAILLAPLIMVSLLGKSRLHNSLIS